MIFLHSSNHSKQQLLATGDKQGNLHLFEVPRSLARAHSNETSLMHQFVEREVLRCAYVAERQEVRRQEAAQLEAAAAEGGGGESDAAAAGGAVAAPGAPSVGDGDGDGAGRPKKTEEELVLSAEELAELQA